MIESIEKGKTAIMAELTIQIPDELAEQLESLQARLLNLLTQLLLNTEKESIEVPPSTQIYNKVLNFLLKSPTPQEIIAFKVSPQAQKRLQTLLLKNREATLTDNENTELDVYEKLEHLIILLKVQIIQNVHDDKPDS